jgi:hypothetical protein
MEKRPRRKWKGLGGGALVRVAKVVDGEGLPTAGGWLSGVMHLHTKRGKLEPQVY